MLVAIQPVLALLLPPVLGYQLLRRFSTVPLASPGVRSTLTAQGLLVGYALIGATLWVDARLFGVFHTSAILLATLVVVVALSWWQGHTGTTAPRLVRKLRDQDGRAGAAIPRARRDLTMGTILPGICLALLVLHLLLVAIEIAWRPVFPWDAWLNWMYRAKLWYYENQIIPLSEPSAWLLGQRPTTYNVAGAHYPPLQPLIAVWVASALGAWSDTLVNLPTLLLGGALALGVFGQCRQGGLSTTLSLAAAATLLSTPLIGAHLALAGQADIWMTGYAGLGMLSVLHGVLHDQRGARWLGLGLCLLGTAVKLEGWLWLGLATVLVALRGHLRAASLGSLAGLVILAAASQWLPAEWLERLTAQLPLPGLMSTSDALNRELADDYLANYLLGSSWHLGGWLLAAASLWALWQQRRSGDREAALLLAFTALQGCLLLLVFNFSRHGAWADDWTAINRLPLQLLPAHCYLWLRLARRLLATDPPALRSWLIALAGLLPLLCAAWLLLQQASTPDMPIRRFSGDDLRVVVGAGNSADGTLQLQRYRNNLAIASSGPVALDLSRLPVARVVSSGSSEQRVTFFWRRTDDGELYSTPIPARGEVILDLRGSPGGPEMKDGKPLPIREFGILAYRHGDAPALAISELEFRPATPGTLLNKLWGEWARGSGWTQRSVHWVGDRGGDRLLAPTLAAALCVLAMTASVLLFRGGAGAGRIAIATIALLWLLLDLRWLFLLGVQARATVASYPLFSASAHAFSDDRRIADSVTAALTARSASAANDTENRVRVPTSGANTGQAPPAEPDIVPDRGQASRIASRIDSLEAPRPTQLITANTGQAPPAEPDIAPDRGQASRIASRIDSLEATRPTLLITAERADLRYQMLRAKYHAAPVPALVLEEWWAQTPQAGDDILLLRPTYGGSTESERSLSDFQALIAPRGLRLRLLASTEDYSLARIEKASGAAGPGSTP